MARKSSPPSKSPATAPAAKPKGAVARSTTKPAAKKAVVTPPAAKPATKKPAAVKLPVAKPTAAKPAATKKGPIALRTSASTKVAIDEPEKYYVVAEQQDLRISKGKPASNGHVASAKTFDEAKDKAVDYLIALIDTYERRLWELKKSTEDESSW